MLSPGDVLLYKSPALKFSTSIAKIIQVITGNSITHVALYVGRTNRGHLILEALGKGVYVKTFDDRELFIRTNDMVLVGVARLKLNPYFTTIDVSEVCKKYDNKPYGILTILNLLLQHGKTRVFPKKQWSTWFKSTDAYICSEATQLVLEELVVGSEAIFPKPANLTEPDDYLDTNHWDILPENLWKI